MNLLQFILRVCFIIFLLNFSQITSAANKQPKLSNSSLVNGFTRTWWKEAVVYEVYIRSFKDANSDGIGDLKGVTAKLDYLKNLGVNVIWLTPYYDSPNVDNGYDIRNYRKIMKEFGTMKDFNELLHGIKKRNMKLIIDLVVNHTSNEHRWFVESRKNKTNRYRQYYIWRPANKGNPPNNYTSFFSGSAWTLDPATNEYYLHYFAKQQPDLNWDNPKVRTEIYDMMKFWLNKGIDGFRMDVIPFISKDQQFPNLTATQLHHPELIYANGPRVHQYLQEMNRNVLSKYDAMTVGESFGVTLAQTPLFVDERRHELNMIFNFDAAWVYQNEFKWRGWTLPQLKAIYARQYNKLNAHTWSALFISNHDSPRVVSTFGDDSSNYRVPSAKLLATMLLTLKGTPFIYQGDELGMTNYPFKSITEFQDVGAQNGWQAEVSTGKISAKKYLANLRKVNRDNARTPMQWDNSKNAGFTTAPKAWLAVNPNYKKINAKQELADPNSVYHYFQKLIQLRKHTLALIYGDYHDLDPTNQNIFIYTRTLGKEKYLIVLNFSRDVITYQIPQGIKVKQLVISNLGKGETNTSKLKLRGWESRIYKY